MLLFWLHNPEELHTKLRSKGGIAALLEMAARSGHVDVFAEVARGFANFASSELTISTQGDVYIYIYTIFSKNRIANTFSDHLILYVKIADNQSSNFFSI